MSVSASDVDAASQVQVDNINDRVRYITSKSQLDLELDVAADRLVVLELMAETACETGLFEPEPEDHWTPQSEQKQKKMEVCAGIRHSYVEMAADSPDSRFLAVMVCVSVQVVKVHNVQPHHPDLVCRNSICYRFAGGGI